MKNQTFEQAFDPKRCGTQDQTWHIMCPKLAIKPFGKFLKQLKLSVCLGFKELISNPNQTYLIDGVLNRTWYHKQGEDRMRIKKQENHLADNTDAQWRHSIAVVGGKLKCRGLCPRGVDIANLHLDHEGM